MHAFDVLGDPVRRRILELLADGAVHHTKEEADEAEESGQDEPPRES